MESNANAAASRCAVTLPRAIHKQLAQPAPMRLLLQLAFEWSCILLVILWVEHSPSLAHALSAMLLIATRQHALLALMHEFAHRQLSRKRPWLNDLVGDLFTALPFFITVEGFRRNHMPHHRHTATDADPNWVAARRLARYRFPKTRLQLALEVLKHGIGFYTLAELKRYTSDAQMATRLGRRTRLLQAGSALAVIGVAACFDLWRILLLYWLLPLSTFLMAMLYIRDIGEHFGMDKPGILGSRTVIAGPLERLLICQNRVNYHAEHHLYPSVPFFRLPQLHAHLVRDPAYRRQAALVHGYFPGLFEEVSRAQIRQPAAGEA